MPFWELQGQENLGRRVSELQFENSPHVQHMRHHPDLYCSTLAEFLKELDPVLGSPGLSRKPSAKVTLLLSCYLILRVADIIL